MNILHLCNPVNIPPKGYGGTPRMVYSLARKQAERGHTVTVIAGKPSKIPKVKDASFLKGRPYVEKKFIANRMFTGYCLRGIYRSRKTNYDIIHNHISEEAISCSLLAKSPMLTTLHCPLSLRNFWPFVTTSITSILPKKTNFVANSQRSFDAYRPFYGKNLISYVHNGMDVDLIQFTSKPNKEAEIQLCFLGKLIFEKRPHWAIQIADLIYQNTKDFKLFIMGKLDFPHPRYGMNLLKMAKKRKYISILPNVDSCKLNEILGNSDALLSTSFEIGLQMSQLEALARGTPIVGLTGGSAEEVVVEGVNGYLAPNLRMLANKCLNLSNIDRNKCREIVEKQFSTDGMFREYMKLYSAIVSEQV